MKNISSFKIDHTKLLPGLYVSRKDVVGSETITTFDIRVCQPNVESVMTTDEIHTIEHIAATYLRNDPIWGDNVLYFGPMGCRTGFYLILAGNYTSRNMCQLMYECFTFISAFEGDIPGASAKECGNYTDMNLSLAKRRAESYLKVLEDISDAQLVYPEGV